MKRMKKLLALALSGVMALSCTIFASADTGDYAGGFQYGTGEFESVLPDGKVRIVLPTQVAGAFDMILDPHSLIKQTGAARYTTGATAPVFEGADSEEAADQVYLFFKNTDTEKSGGLDYSSKSDAYDVLNKSSFDVDLKVSVEMEKGIAGDSFSLVEKDAVATAEGAAMYLGLNVQDVNAVEDTSAAGTYSIEADSESAAQEIAVLLDDDAQDVDAAPTATAAGVKVGTDTSKAAEAKALISNISVVFNAGASKSDKQEVVTALTHAARAADTAATPQVEAITPASLKVEYAADGTVTFTGTLPVATSDKEIPVTYTASPTGLTVTASVDNSGSANFDPTKKDHFTDAYFSIPVKKTVTVYDYSTNPATSSTQSVTIAKIRGKISGAAAFAIGNNTAEATVSFGTNSTKVKALSSATYSTSLAAFDSAYANVFKADSAGSTSGEYVLAYYSDTTTFNNQQATDKLAALASDLQPIKGLEFNLVGAINPSDDWDKLDGEANNIDIVVIWDVTEAESRAKKPTLSVDAPITGSASSVVFNWTPGTGKYADYSPSPYNSTGAKYSQNGTPKNLTTAANGTSTTSFKVNGVGSTVRVATNTNFVVIFKSADPSKEDIEVAFPTGWYS